MFFQTKILCKKRGCFLKMAGTDNNKLMELLIIAGGSLLLSQEHFKGKRKQKKQKKNGRWKRKTDSKGAYYSIINDLSLKEKLKLFKEKLKLCVSNFSILCKWTLSKSSLQDMLVSVFMSCNSGNKRTYSAQVRIFCVLLKIIISV